MFRTYSTFAVEALSNDILMYPALFETATYPFSSAFPPENRLRDIGKAVWLIKVPFGPFDEKWSGPGAPPFPAVIWMGARGFVKLNCVGCPPVFGQRLSYSCQWPAMKKSTPNC